MPLFHLKKIFIFSFLFIFSCLISSCVLGKKKIPKDYKELVFRGESMGTYYKIIVLIPTNQNKVAYIQEDVDQILKSINQSMSTYKTNSEISLLNQSSLDIDHLISKEFAEVVTQALKISQLTDGYYDITVEPLIKLWGFYDPLGTKKQKPDVNSILLTLQKVDYQGLILSEKLLDKAQGKQFFIKKIKDVSLNLSSIAKGYVIDLIANHFQQKFFYTNYLIDIGGEIKGHGHNYKKQPWMVAIREPRSDGKISLYTTLLLSNQALATSGDYENFFTQNNERLSHIINPKTGYPIKHNTVSVSVLHSNCMIADGWATALLSMGSKKGLILAEKLKLPALFIDYKINRSKKESLWEEFKTSTWNEYINKK